MWSCGPGSAWGRCVRAPPAGSRRRCARFPSRPFAQKQEERPEGTWPCLPLALSQSPSVPGGRGPHTSRHAPRGPPCGLLPPAPPLASGGVPVWVPPGLPGPQRCHPTEEKAGENCGGEPPAPPPPLPSGDPSEPPRSGAGRSGEVAPPSILLGSWLRPRRPTPHEKDRSAGEKPTAVNSRDPSPDTSRTPGRGPGALRDSHRAQATTPSTVCSCRQTWGGDWSQMREVLKKSARKEHVTVTQLWVRASSSAGRP